MAESGRQSDPEAGRPERPPWLGLGLTWFVALNLRAGLIGVGPILPRLTEDLDLSQTQGSALVALPTALMGLAALPGGRLADRAGARAAVIVGLALVAVGGGLRAAAGGYVTLVLLTVIFGTGIGLTQPALPRLARGLLPARLGLATGVYAGGFFAGSFLAAFLTAPVLLPLSDSGTWRLPLAIWGGLAAIGLLVWIVTLPGWRLREERVPPLAKVRMAAGLAGWTPWRDGPSWRVAALFAGQGVAYYLLVAWLPSVYEGAGVEETTGGALFALFNVAAFPAMVGLPPLSDRLGSRRAAAVLAGSLFLAGSLGLALAPHVDGWRWLWPLLTGFGVGGLFAMGLVLPADVAPRHSIGATAGMILGIGYLGSALGPIIGGVARDVTGSFDAALALMPILGVALVALALALPRRIVPREGTELSTERDAIRRSPRSGGR